MTDVLLKPDDTGDIPLGIGETTRRLVGEDTRNLAPYVDLPPALRRPTAALTLIGELVPPGQPKPPRPLPNPGPPPTPKVDDEIVWAHADPSDTYMGRHRKPSRWDWLTVPLAMAWQRIGRAM